MAKKIDKGPPRLIRRLIDFEKYTNQGLSTAWLVEEITKLSQDEPELTVAMQFLRTCDRLADLAKFEDQEALALFKEAQRTDLTIPEALLLYKTAIGKMDRIEAAALREIERERLKRFGSS